MIMLFNKSFLRLGQKMTYLRIFESGSSKAGYLVVANQELIFHFLNRHYLPFSIWSLILMYVSALGPLGSNSSIICLIVNTSSGSPATIYLFLPCLTMAPTSIASSTKQRMLKLSSWIILINPLGSLSTIFITSETKNSCLEFDGTCLLV